jgi:NAD(P)-dependent dehydrogenase (short-subunit alcohol dehydrogenase family)
MAVTWGEMFPQKASYTEKDMPDQYGHVFIVTGGSAGVGYEVAKTLYHLNGRVYIASRSETTAKVAIASIQASKPAKDQVIKSGKGEVIFLRLDLGDLTTIKASAMEFLSKESRLDVIWHNAGIMVPSDDTPTKQGYHVQLGINALGPFLFQHYLTPLCLKTASLPSNPKSATRIIFVSSSGHRTSPTPDGVQWDDISRKGNWFPRPRAQVWPKQSHECHASA